jgi:hypothetical protein
MNGTILEIIENITEFNLVGAVFLTEVTGGATPDHLGTHGQVYVTDT